MRSLQVLVPPCCLRGGLHAGLHPGLHCCLHFSFCPEAVFRLILSLLFSALLCVAGVACAGSFSIDPVRIHLSEARPSAVMRVENRGDAAITVQLQAMSWSQSGNQDQLVISRELLAM